MKISSIVFVFCSYTIGTVVTITKGYTSVAKRALPTTPVNMSPARAQVYWVIGLASQPTSAWREGSGQLSIRMLSRWNVISYATFGLCLCDRGIISRCSAAPQQSGHASSDTSTICSSRLPGPSR